MNTYPPNWKEIARRRPGPPRSCNCEDLIGCMTCRKREQQRRFANGLDRLPVLPHAATVRQSRLKLPTEATDLAYIAGLLDGEGCVTRTNGKHVVVQIGMTDRPVIEYLGTIGGTVRVEEGPKRGNRKPLYRWRILARVEVIEFLRAVAPYLRVKRELVMERLDELLSLERIA